MFKKQLYFLSLLFILTSFNLKAQQQIGVGVGYMSYTGDLSPTFSFRPHGMGSSYFYRYQFSSAIGFKLNMTIANIEADDKSLNNSFRTTRNYDFASFIPNLYLSFEYNFLNMTGKRVKHRIVNPYIQVGIGVLQSTTKASNTQNNLSVQFTNYTPTAVMGFGIKKQLTDRLTLALEGTFLFSFSDKIDNITSTENLSKFFNSNIAGNDHLQYINLSLSYSFFSLRCPDHYLFEKK